MNRPGIFGCCLSCIVVVCLASPVHAADWPQIPGMMQHILIDFDGADLALHHPHNGPMDLVNYDEIYKQPADVLNNKAYNDQFGWLANGFFSPPDSTAFWVRVLNQTAGLETFEGGMRPLREFHSYDPIFGTDGSPDFWQWNGTMTHNWYAATDYGHFEASYEVYVGDLSGAKLDQYGTDTITLRWSHVPEPASLLLLALGGAWGMRRRR